MTKHSGYLRLCELIADERRRSAAADALVAELGPTGALIRGLGHARRHEWSSARANLLAAVEGHDDLAPIVEYVAGIGFYVVRDHDRALVHLARAAARGKPGLAKQARLYARRFAAALGWTQEQRELEARLGAAPPTIPELDGDPQRAAEQAWAAMYERGPELARAELDRFAAGTPTHPAVLAALVRLDLVCGSLDAAADRLADLPAALERPLRGELAILALARGDLDRVLAYTEAPGDDPRLLTLRGEALRAKGELLEACELLELARQRHPSSVVINLALTLAHHHRAPRHEGDGFERRFQDLAERAPGLLGDAAAQLDLELWTDQGAEPLRAQGAAILHEARRMLSPELDLDGSSYRRSQPDAPLRLAAAPGPLHTHDDDRALTEHAEGVLFRALGISPPRPPGHARELGVVAGTRAPWTPQTLSEAEIEQFLTDGFIVIPRAFDPELARAWREDANRRIREQPERWVRGYDPANPRHSLRSYDPEDPSTWSWSRLNLEGPETVVIEEFAPRAWGAICDLLGGPERIKTRTWTNYLIINFCADAHLGIDAPAPDWDSWHIDDPSPLTRLDRIVNGLIGIALFDRLLPKSGNTWIAPDSVGRVARELAAHPEGVDFVTDRGNRITEQCERFHEVTGECGDLLLMHPLMMHSSSPNRSGRIRWMSNPMVYLHEPLDPHRPEPELSLVERMIRDAIR